MIAFLRPNCTLKDRADVIGRVEAAGLAVRIEQIDRREALALVGASAEALGTDLAEHPAVLEIKRLPVPYELVSRALQSERTTVHVGSVAIGGGAPPVVIAGPCSVETEAQVNTTAEAVAAAGAQLLRGGAFKPRTSPYSFQGLGHAGLELLAAAGRRVGLPTVTEVVASEDVELVAEKCDVLQIGARNMQNFRLLEAAGRAGRPVLLKRGMMSTIEELLLAAEYLLAAGNPDVILCERGIRTFEPTTRNTLDIAAIPVLQERTHLPVIADPSHACGVARLVAPLSRAALAAGADGLIVEVHPRPEEALSDGPQALLPEQFAALMACVPLAAACAR